MRKMPYRKKPEHKNEAARPTWACGRKDEPMITLIAMRTEKDEKRAKETGRLLKEKGVPEKQLPLETKNGRGFLAVPFDDVVNVMRAYPDVLFQTIIWKKDREPGPVPIPDSWRLCTNLAGIRESVYGGNSVYEDQMQKEYEASGILATHEMIETMACLMQSVINTDMLETDGQGNFLGTNKYTGECTHMNAEFVGAECVFDAITMGTLIRALLVHPGFRTAVKRMAENGFETTKEESV